MTLIVLQKQRKKEANFAINEQDKVKNNDEFVDNDFEVIKNSQKPKIKK